MLNSKCKKMANWEHKPNSIPQLDYEDLLTIIYLVEKHGKREIPIHSSRLMKKVEESVISYKIEQDLLKKQI